jgi:hypothetical protein
MKFKQILTVELWVDDGHQSEVQEDNESELQQDAMVSVNEQLAQGYTEGELYIYLNNIQYRGYWSQTETQE